MLVLLVGATSMVLAQDTDFDIYDIEEVREIRITFPMDNWEAELDALKQAGKDERMTGDVSYGGKLYKGAGIRYKGNSSYKSVRKSGYSKLPFNIDVNETEKKNKMPGGYDKLKLSNVFRDPSFIREVLSYEIARDYMPASRANFVKLYINDRYMGLYNNTESVDDEFLDYHYGEHKGVLIKCDPIWGHKTPSECPEGEKASLQYLGPDSVCYYGKYELKSDHGWGELIQLTQALRDDPEKLTKLLNIDQALWMLAFNTVLVNLDSYTGRFCHNYYLYQDETGVFHPIVWDMNLSFGGFQYLGLTERLQPMTQEDLQTLSPFAHYKQQNEKRPLITQLLSDETYKKIYVAHIRAILNDHFRNGQYLKRAKAIQTLIDEEVKQDTNKLYDYAAFQKNLTASAKADQVSIIGIAELMEARVAYLNQHSLVSKKPPIIEKGEHLDFDADWVFNLTVGEGTRAWLYYRYGSKGAFQRVEMFDDGGHNDDMENDGIWGATLKKPADGPMEYYFVAENADAAALLPERAAFEFLSTK